MSVKSPDSTNRAANIPSSPLPIARQISSSSSSHEVQPSSTDSLLIKFKILRQQLDQKLNFIPPRPIPETPVNWENKTNQELQAFVSKTSMLATVKAMDEGIEDSLAMQIVNEANIGKRALYDVFREKYGHTLHWTRRFSARWKYFLYYQSGIINNILETFATNFLSKIRSKVQKDEGKHLLLFINTQLNEINSFLDQYLHAVESFAKSQDVDRNQHVAAQLKQNTDINEICNRFTELTIKEFLPHVDLFKKLKSSIFLYVFGWILDATIGWIFNRFILQPVLRHKIPSAMQSLLESNGSISFIYSVTHGIHEQMLKIKKFLETQNVTPSIQKSSNPAFEHLQDVVNKLIKALQLESKVKADLQQQNRPGPLDFTPQIYQNIGPQIIKGINDGYQALLRILSNQTSSGKAFFQLLKFSNSIYDPPFQTTDQMRMALPDLKNNTRNLAWEVFRTLIGQSAEEFVQGSSENHFQRSKANFEGKYNISATEVARHLALHVQSMNQKIQSMLTDDASNPKNIIQDLNEIINDIRSYRLFFENETHQSDIQREIHAASVPLFSELNNLCNQIPQARVLLEQLNEPYLLYKKLQQIQEMQQHLEKIDVKVLNKTIDYLLNHKIHQFKTLTKQPTITCYLQLQIENKICQLLRNLLLKENLIKQFKNATTPDQWNHIKHILYPVLELLPNDEKKPVINLISSLIENNFFWKSLGNMIETIQQKHLKNLGSQLQGICPWYQNYRQECEAAIQDTKGQLDVIRNRILQLTQSLQNTMPKIQIVNLESRTQSVFHQTTQYIRNTTAPAVAYVSGAAVAPSLMTIFDNLNEFILNPHLCKWSMIHSIKSLNEAFAQN